MSSETNHDGRATGLDSGPGEAVWIADQDTLDRRDWIRGYGRAISHGSQARAGLAAYLSHYGVRLEEDTDLAAAPDAARTLRAVREWSPAQWRVIEGFQLEMRHALEEREHWRNHILQEVRSNPNLLSIARLCGAPEIVAFALGAFVGDINRFANPKKLVNYAGLAPAPRERLERSATGLHGNKMMRALFIEWAQTVLAAANTPLAGWGQGLLDRTGAPELVLVAMARKLAVSVWYLMKGSPAPVPQAEES